MKKFSKIIACMFILTNLFFYKSRAGKPTVLTVG